MADLPTVEECREFLRVINEGRALIDLPPLDVLDFDEATPGQTDNCLSARNLFSLAGYAVGPDCLYGSNETPDVRVMALTDFGKLPDEIRRVTDVFDMGEAEALRARMVEAGVVAP